jgi:hypothetical protein
MSDAKTIEQHLAVDQRQLLEAWYGDYHAQSFGMGSTEATGAAGDLLELFQKWCDRSDLNLQICTGWKYCEQRGHLGNKAQLLAALSDFIAAYTGLNTNGACAAAVLLAQFGLDGLCRCGG